MHAQRLDQVNMGVFRNTGNVADPGLGLLRQALHKSRVAVSHDLPKFDNGAYCFISVGLHYNRLGDAGRILLWGCRNSLAAGNQQGCAGY